MPEPLSKPAAASPNQAQALARILRHEIGDLLQTVYATVAILQERLPADSALERRILADLRTRAGQCKDLLDNVNDYVAPLELEREPVDLSEVLSAQAARIRIRFPKIAVEVLTPPGGSGLTADARRLTQIVGLLLHVACEAAQNRVECRVTVHGSPRQVECNVEADGAPSPDIEGQELFDPFPQNRYSHRGLLLALARRLAEAQGGRVTGDAPAAGGIRLALRFLLASANGRP